MTISEDTPEGGPEDQQWRIDGLTDMLKRANDELERERRCHTHTKNMQTIAQDRFDTLTSRLAVGVLRKAGYIVRIEEAEFCEACGEEYS
jgi:hypothetical protein